MTTSERWDWQSCGACRSFDPELVFHPHGERGAVHAAREAAAKRICTSCPVLATCREHALASHEPCGVWGGLSETERGAAAAGAGSRTGTGEGETT